MDGNDRVQRIVLPRKQRLSFQAVDHLLQSTDLAVQLGIDLLPLVGQLEISGDIFVAPIEVRISSQRFLKALFFAHHLLGFLGIRPEVGVRSLFVDFGQLLAQFACVKGTPAEYELFPSGQRIAVRVLQPCTRTLSLDGM